MNPQDVGRVNVPKTGRKFLRFGATGALEKGLRQNVQLGKAQAKNATPTTILARRERELRNLGVKIGKKEARVQLLEARKSGAEALRDATHAWVWPLNVIIGAPMRGFWNWRVRRLNRKSVAVQNLIQALETKSSAVEKFYDAQLGLRELRRTTKIEKRQAALGVAMQRILKKMPAVRTRLTKSIADLPVMYATRIGKTYTNRLRAIIAGIPTRVSGAPQAIELETYIRLMREALADGDYPKAKTYIDMAYAFTTRPTP
jgi:hypothetical protein